MTGFSSSFSFDQVIEVVIEAQELLIGCEKKVGNKQESSDEHAGTGNDDSIPGGISGMLNCLGGFWNISSNIETNRDEKHNQEDDPFAEPNTSSKLLTQQSMDTIYEDIPFHSLQQFLMSSRNSATCTTKPLENKTQPAGEPSQATEKTYETSAVEPKDDRKKLLELSAARRSIEVDRKGPKSDFALTRSFFEAVGIDRATLKPSALSSKTDDKPTPAEITQLQRKKASRDLAGAMKLSDGSSGSNSPAYSSGEAQKSNPSKSSKSHGSPQLYGFLRQTQAMS